MDDINSLLQLAGIQNIEPEIIDKKDILISNIIDFLTNQLDSIPQELIDQIEVDVIINIPEVEIMDENAEFDYRTNPAKPKGEDGEIGAYKFLGTGNLDVRYTPARSSDNPLTGKRGTTSISERKFSDYLKNIEE